MFSIVELQLIETKIANFMDESLSLKLHDRIPTEAEQDMIVHVINEEAKELCLRARIDPNLQFKFNMSISAEGNCKMETRWIISRYEKN